MAKLTSKKTTAAAKGGKAPAKTTSKSTTKSNQKSSARKGTALAVKARPAGKSAKGAVVLKRVETRSAPARGATARINGRAKSIPAPVPMPLTPVKPGRNQAGLKTRELESFRELLLAKRRELLGDVASMEEEALRSTTGSNLSNLPIHMADMGSDNYEQEFTLGLVEKDRQLLREINIALAKIRDGSYGICEGTGKPIAKARLEAKPWAKYSIEYMQKLENGLVRR